ncbi:MAG TPA: type II secretion system minor pseudopilin GspI [Burkholderiales bacterium]|nr:type II secretion system minor pseudopilin GspI [Burkholderiales bacterium]
MARPRYSGFTLIEVLAALAIAAITLAAAARAVALSAEHAAEGRSRVLAGFVAENRVAELVARRAWPAPGRYDGVERQAGMEFVWRADVAPTVHPAIRRIEVRVALSGAPGHDLRRLVAMLPRDP